MTDLTSLNSSAEMVSENIMLTAGKPSAQIGDRIECSGQIGTVKYIGTVDGYSATWLGIDWDDATRGKHDGTVNGVQYFIANHPKSGSFVRPEKVQLGQSIIQAIMSRYGQRMDKITRINEQQLLLSMQQVMNAPFLKFVGFDKISDVQSNFTNLKVVFVRSQGINNVGDENELIQLCPNIEELDISKNLLNNWTRVFEICDQLKYLSWLNVSENLMKLPDNYTDYEYPQVKTLVCGNTGLTWEDILKLAKIFPNLEELQVHYNNITDLTSPEDHSLMNLKSLDLEKNPIGNWNEICKLHVISNLENLNIINIGLKKIAFENSENGQKVDILNRLTKLAISENEIEDWESLGELNKLQNLELLRFLKNPLLEKETYTTCVQLIIARIPNLKSLNGSAITADERRGAEYDYIRKYGLEYIAAQKDPEKLKQFSTQHSQYLELIQKHGAPEESELLVQSKVISTNLVQMELRYLDRKILKKLPPTILVQKLITLVQKLFNLSERPTLKYISNKQPDIEIELTDEFKEFGFYSIQDGDKLIVTI